MRRGWKIALLFWVSLVLVTEPFPNENIEEMGATKILSIQGESEYLQKIIFIRYLTVISTFSHTMSRLDFDSHCVFLSNNRWRRFQSWRGKIRNAGGCRSPRRWRYSSWDSTWPGSLHALKICVNQILFFFQVLCYLPCAVLMQMRVKRSQVLAVWLNDLKNKTKHLQSFLIFPQRGAIWTESLLLQTMVYL